MGFLDEMWAKLTAPAAPAAGDVAVYGSMRTIFDCRHMLRYTMDAGREIPEVTRKDITDLERFLVSRGTLTLRSRGLSETEVGLNTYRSRFCNLR